MQDLPIAVQEISKMNFSGNIIPQSWFAHVCFESGKPDLIGIVILAEVVYWYRASEIRDENTGKIAVYKKKFKSDKLQRSYQSFADLFGISKRQARDAIHRLRNAGLISVEYRTVPIQMGMSLSNVVFIEPIPEQISKITYRTSERNR